MVFAHLFSHGTSNISQVTALFYISTSNDYMSDSVSLHPLQNLVLSLFFISDILRVCNNNSLWF